MDYRLALMCGSDLAVPECQLILHQPSISEISLLGEKDFFVGVQCLCLYKSMFIDEDKIGLFDINNFQIFMTIMQEKEAKDKKRAVFDTLALLFPDYKINFTPMSIMFQKDDMMSMVDENNFEQLQEVFRLVFCMKNAPMDQTAFNPKGEKAKEIAQKLMRGRERIAAEHNDASSSTLGLYLSTLSVGLHIPLDQLVSLKMYQLYDLMERFMLWVNWDMDIRSRLAGAKPQDKVDNWMKNIH